MRLARLAVMAGVGLVVAWPGGSQTLAPDVAKQVDAVFTKRDRPDSPGSALGIYRGGEIVYKRGYGMEDLNEDVHITPGTVFHVASMSKQFTAAAVVLLTQQGKLSLDDDVRKYIPELPDFDGSTTRAVTRGAALSKQAARPPSWSSASSVAWLGRNCRSL
ncbi:MAG: beta-lactamase family protein [Acidobacteria bacterium]|nr:beta-lactamase family protein [Acidobacteriota bacterium]